MTTTVLVALLLLVLTVLVGNTMIAIAFLRGRKDNFKGVGGRDGNEIDELHHRIEELSRKKE